MEMQNINGNEIRKLIENRNLNSKNEYVIIENKIVSDFHSIECENIIFKNCYFEESCGNIFSNSFLQNIILENCCWYDSTVKNTYFKNLTMVQSIIHNNVEISNCTFDNLIFQNSIMRFQGFENCEIKNTDFRGQEYFFLQTINLDFAYELYLTEQLQNLTDVIIKNPEQFVIPWYSLKYTNCLIDFESIKKLSSYSNKIDSNYSTLAPTPYLTGFINLDGAEQVTKYFLIAGTFLYDAKQSYFYDGDCLNKEYRKEFEPPMFLIFKDYHIDISKYKKTVTTTKKSEPMTIIDDNRSVIDFNQIPPLGQITFISKFLNDNFLESNFDASTLNKRTDVSKLIRSIW
ncbi:MAG: pentapeptide repeat-containing protein [Bacilli bacterium]|nr:pentapeptide repeat-containing protein [Bacilli bacterium]